MNKKLSSHTREKVKGNHVDIKGMKLEMIT